jgi:ABC-type Fe3+/spermidine/putrescine transport system ATPase subunit
MAANVSLEGTTKQYGNVKAVDDVSLRIEAYEFVTLFGFSGSG